MLSMDDVYREYSRTVYRYLLSLTHDAGIAEELTQETFYQAIKSAERFDGSCKVSTWLCAIAKNIFLSDRRRHPKTEEPHESFAAPDSPEDETIAKSCHVELLQKLHLLDEAMREVMYLRLLGSLSFCEIGEVLGRTENWARVTYYRGKEKLKKELEADGK